VVGKKRTVAKQNGLSCIRMSSHNTIIEEIIRKSTSGVHIVPLRPSTKLATWFKSCSDTSFLNIKGNGEK